MRRTFQAFLALFGVVVIGISLAHLAMGPETIISLAEADSTSGQILLAALAAGTAVIVVALARRQARRT